METPTEYIAQLEQTQPADIMPGDD